MLRAQPVPALTFLWMQVQSEVLEYSQQVDHFRRKRHDLAVMPEQPGNGIETESAAADGLQVFWIGCTWMALVRRWKHRLAASAANGSNRAAVSAATRAVGSSTEPRRYPSS